MDEASRTSLQAYKSNTAKNIRNINITLYLIASLNNICAKIDKLPVQNNATKKEMQRHLNFAV
jgi:hypothetical protein